MVPDLILYLSIECTAASYARGSHLKSGGPKSGGWNEPDRNSPDRNSVVAERFSTGRWQMAEDNQDQAQEMAREGLEKAKGGAGKAGQGRELIEEAKRLDHDAVADIAPESEDTDRGDPTAIQPQTPKE
jgi:hypothetical protein